MIPRTFPSEFVTPNGKTQAIVYSLPSVSGLKAWIDYIPVKGVANSNTVVENTYAADGYMLVRNLDAISGMTPFKDYIPVYEDATATKPWSTDVGGYIPMYGLFSIQGLFAAGEQGAWYDPSDLTTLFQDSAGTTPVTAVEQPVGLMLDKSKGPVLGPELVTNGDFSNGATGWSALSFPVNDGSIVVSGGVATITTGLATIGYAQQLSLVVGKMYRLSGLVEFVSGGGASIAITNAAKNAFVVQSALVTTVGQPVRRDIVFTATETNPWVYMRAGNHASVGKFSDIQVKELPGNHAYQSTSAARPVLSARYNLLTATATLATQSVTTNATTQTLRFEGTGTITLSGTATGTYSAGTHSITTTAGTLTLTVSGTVTRADLRAANDGVGLPSYQAVTNSTTYDTAGFPLYIKPNGSSQFMVTNNIVPGTDKAQVFAGVRKLSDSATGLLVSTTSDPTVTPGSIGLLAPSASGANSYLFTTSSRPVGFGTFSIAPVTSVVCGIGNISGDSAILRVNGTQIAAATTADQGTGNYLTSPLYLFARAGNDLWYGGRFYGMILRFGPTLTAAQISSTEAWMNTKTKAF